MKFDWLNIFPKPIKFRVTCRIRTCHHYEIGLSMILSNSNRLVTLSTWK